MRTFILIGGIGSGKSTVSALLRQLGACCIDLDDLGHEVLLQPETIRDLVEEFGEGVLDSKGAVDRRALAAAAFASPECTQALNGITQPRIVSKALSKLDEAQTEGYRVAIVEISPYEGPLGQFHPIECVSQGIIAVTAPENMRIERAVSRGFDEADVRNRIYRQVSDEQRASWADYVIVNDGSIEQLKSQVETVWYAINA